MVYFFSGPEIGTLYVIIIESLCQTFLTPPVRNRFKPLDAMKYRDLHRWGLTPKEAIALQSSLRERIVLEKIDLRGVRMVAGVDVSVKDDQSQAAIVVLSYPGLERIEAVSSRMKTCFPYIPGLLSFREAPVILECVRKLKNAPDVFVFDGQGLAHPRRIGIASHLGLFLEKPSIGSAKSHLYGKYDPAGRNKGDFSLMKDDDGSVLGAVVTTRDGTNPVFVSPGHLADIRSSVELILNCSPRYKIPEPIRAAHRAASLVKA